MEIFDFNSSVFLQSRANLDEALKKVMSEVYNGNFASGDVNLKVNVEVIPNNLELDFRDTYTYMYPAIKTTITTTLKKTNKTEWSESATDLEITDGDEGFILTKIPKTQLSIDDIIVIEKEDDN